MVIPVTPPDEPQPVILVADDDQEHNEAVAWRLRHEGFAVVTATSGRDCLEKIMRQEFDSVLLDQNLGDMPGTDVLVAIRAERPANVLPVLMITGETDSSITVRALADGANDYITKPVDLDVAVARIRNQLALRTATEALQRRALHDPLTGLPNRALLSDRLESALARSRRSGSPLAVFLFDLDGFKAVNDTLGHNVGDALLKAVAGRLLDCIRESDTAVRLGGDEFVVLAEGVCTPDDAAIIAARFEEAICAPFDIDGNILRIGVSVGTHVVPAGTHDDLETLLGHADAAMYSAKRARKKSLIAG